MCVQNTGLHVGHGPQEPSSPLWRRVLVAMLTSLGPRHRQIHIFKANKLYRHVFVISPIVRQFPMRVFGCKCQAYRNAYSNIVERLAADRADAGGRGDGCDRPGGHRPGEGLPDAHQVLGAVRLPYGRGASRLPVITSYPPRELDTRRLTIGTASFQ